MSQVLLFSPPNFRGVITDTPSGTGYSTAPGQTIAADERDVALLLTYGFTSAAPPVSTDSMSLSIYDQNGNSVTSVGMLTFEGVIVSGTTPSGIVNTTTITGADGGTNAHGVNLNFAAGDAGTVGSSVYAGNIYLYAGSGSTYPVTGYNWGGGIGARAGMGGMGVNSKGGAITQYAGSGGYGTNTAYGGDIISGAGSGGQYAVNGFPGKVIFRAGDGFGTDIPGGYVYFATGSARGTGEGGPLRINLGTGSSGQKDGEIEVNGDPSLVKLATLSWIAGETLDARTIGVSIRAALVTAVIVRLDTANGAAGTLVINQCPSGTAPGAGTVLTIDSADLNGMPNANQTLTLSSTLTDLQIAAGTAFCTSTTGTLTLCAGCIEVWGTPQ